MLLYPLGASVLLRCVFSTYLVCFVPIHEVMPWDLENLPAGVDYHRCALVALASSQAQC
jgi:hypothetical protein